MYICRKIGISDFPAFFIVIIMRVALFWLGLISFIGVSGQATVSIMQYNLLYYGTNTTYCTSSNNSVTTKNQNLKIIIDYALPDIFTVNEMASDISYIQGLMDNTLNVNGRTSYKKAGFTNWAGSDIVNMLYYNSDKFVLYSQDVIYHTLRDINVYHLYYKSPDLLQNDTAYLSCIVAHLKAGSNSTDADERADMAEQIKIYVESHGVDKNYLLMGDFNLYTGNEESFQIFVSNPNLEYRFYDPIDMIGDWSNNSYYADYHTQSTHTSGTCPATGGMDDRFDFILISDNIYDGTEKISYINNSYYAIGQDGLRFNQTINSPTNTQVSSTIADALYGMSDHLPVKMQLNINQTPAAVHEENVLSEMYSLTNPVNENLEIFLRNNNQNEKILIEMLDGFGKILISENVYTNSNVKTIAVSMNIYPAGVYIVRISDNHSCNCYKIIKL